MATRKNGKGDKKYSFFSVIGVKYTLLPAE